jgi:hypothetical protein
MSLESISRVVSHALKAASDVSGGTAEEKGALNVLGGLAALLESRIQLHQRASVSATSDPNATAMKSKAPPGTANRERPAASTTDESGDSYDLK